MLTALFNYFKGSVRVTVSGFTTERFLNIAVRKGVRIWNVSRDGGSMQMNVTLKGFRLLRECAKKTGCRVKIAGKNGFPFLMHRYRRRKIFIGGFVFFLAAVYIMTRFIWLVDVSGNDRITKDAVIAACREHGLYVGAFKPDISADDVERSLVRDFPDISWVNVKITGTHAAVSISEDLPRQPAADRETPCDVIARYDGLIESIATSAGTPKVKRQDVVQKGDVLVSSAVEITNENGVVGTVFTHAAAAVTARMYMDFDFDIPYDYFIKAPTGRVAKRYGLILMGKDIFDVKKIDTSIPYVNYDRILLRKQLSLGEDYPLPVILATAVYSEFEQVPQKRTPEQARELAERVVSARLLRELDFSADIMDTKIAYEELADRLHVSATATIVDNIGQQVPVNIVK